MSKIVLKKLNDKKENRKILMSFDRKLLQIERSLDPKLLDSVESIYNDVPKVLKSKDCLVLALFEDDKPIGCAVGRIYNIPKWYGKGVGGIIESVYIEKIHRNKGHGLRLYSELKKWFDTRKVKRIKLRVFSNNKQAVSLYKKLGFKHIVSEMVLEYY